MNRLAVPIVAVCLAITITAAWAAPAKAEPRDYRFDPAQTVVAFMVDHLGFSEVLARFLEVDGGFTYDESTQELTDLRVEIAADSVETHDDARDRHLLSGDFLDAGNHPTITFVGTDATPTGETTGTVSGDLTVRGVSVPVTLDVTLNRIAEYPFATTGPSPNYVIGVSASAILNRADFGMDYALDNGWVGGEVDVIIEIQAIRQ